MYRLYSYLFVSIVSTLLTILLLLGGLYLWRGTLITLIPASVMETVIKESVSRDISDVVPEVIAKANDAVVSVIATKDVPILERYYEQQWDPFGWFGGFAVPRVRERGTEEREIGGGSGFIVSADGLVVTNRHVVSDEDARYTILLNDDTAYAVRVVAKDPVLDIAILQIEDTPGNLPFLEFSTTPLRLGETVIVIGNALAEFRNSVSVGIVSGLARSITARGNRGQTEQLREVIQTDAAINPGNSGGPMLNLEGKVVGVSVATTQGADNISFALPASVVAPVVESVKETGRIVRPYLGVRYAMVTERMKELNNLPIDYGALIVRGELREELAVMPGSPADKAGLRENDIILEINDESLRNTDLATVLRSATVGDELELLILSQGSEKRLTVVLEALTN